MTGIFFSFRGFVLRVTKDFIRIPQVFFIGECDDYSKFK